MLEIIEKPIMSALEMGQRQLTFEMPMLLQIIYAPS